MDQIIVGIIVIIAGYFTFKRFIGKLKPGSGSCGNGCSCGSHPKGCSIDIKEEPKI